MTEDNNIHDAETSEEETSGSKAKLWVEENLRLIVSIIIVFAIAGGIYSYSQRGQENRVALNDETTQEQILLEGEDEMLEDEDLIMEEETTTPANEENVVSEGVSSTQTEELDTEAEEEQAPIQETQEQTPSQPNQETTEGFIITANAGDGLTRMARRALTDYLAQNPDSSLSPAHKIYIEDYVRKSVGHSGGVGVGTQINFSKTLLREAIDASKGLTDSQLDNLQKYVVLVPSLAS